MHFYQIIVVVVSLVMLVQGVIRLALNFSSQSLPKLGARIIVWGGMMVVAVFPGVTTNIAKFIGMEGNINSIILLGFLLVFMIVFRILSIIERIEKDISTIVRKESILEALKEDKK